MNHAPASDPAETVRQLRRDLAGVNSSIAESRDLIERTRDLREAEVDGAADGEHHAGATGEAAPPSPS